MDFGAQEPVVRYLASLESGATIVVTHISIVVLGAQYAYKLKRAVRFPYLDFSTPDRRLAMCEREATLNLRFAPRLYLGARRVTRTRDGGLALDGDGAVVDAIVLMRRFPDDALFDTLARDKRLPGEMIDRLAADLARLHEDSTPDFSRGGAQALARISASAGESLREAEIAAPGEVAAQMAALDAALGREAARLDARRAQGLVRRCHGDLTLRNICLFEGTPTPFDCIEFDDDIAIIDVLYDFAFLLMDLVRIGAHDLSARALNRYLDSRDEITGLRLLPLFMSLRATIRAHVEATQSHHETGRAYFDLARALIVAPTPRLVAIGGRSGAGKSSVAAALAPLLAAPGARTLNSDRIRKKMFGAAPTERLPPDAYASAASERVYAEMFEAAGRIAASGWPVVVDAVFDREQDRARVESIARDAGVPFLGAWLDADFDTLAARVETRRDDVSDATRAVLEMQMARDAGEIAWLRLDAKHETSDIAQRIFDARPSPLPNDDNRSSS